MRDGARAVYLGKRQWIEICAAATGRDNRPDAWFTEQASALNTIAQIGGELALIAANAASYDAWKATLPKGDAA
jgi:hypothetical protein